MSDIKSSESKIESQPESGTGDKRLCRFHNKCTKTTDPDHMSKFICVYTKPCNFGTKCTKIGDPDHEKYFSHNTDIHPKKSRSPREPKSNNGFLTFSLSVSGKYGKTGVSTKHIMAISNYKNKDEFYEDVAKQLSKIYEDHLIIGRLNK